MIHFSRTLFRSMNLVISELWVQRMKDKYGDSSEHIFDELQKAEPVTGFFKGCFELNSKFCIRKMPPILVRSIREWEVDVERKGNPNLCGDSKREDTLYIDDGNHRALVYAVQVMCGESKFEYMPVFWSKSWKWLQVHGEGPQTAEQDFPPAHDGWIFNP